MRADAVNVVILPHSRSGLDFRQRNVTVPLFEIGTPDRADFASCMAHDEEMKMRIRRLLEPAISGDKSPRRSRREMAMMAAAIIAGVIGLSWLTVRVAHPSRGAQSGNTDENLLIRSEVITIFASPALVEWARGLSDPSALESHDEIKSGLRRGGLEKTWYAILYREFESNGNRPVMTTYTRPFETSAKAFEFRAVLATIRGNPPRYPSVNYAGATIRPIPEDLANAEPGEAIAEMMLRWELEESRKGH